MGFDFIAVVPLLLSPCCRFFVFGHELSFFGGFQHPPVDGCSTASCNFGALTGGNKLRTFYSTILNPGGLLLIVFSEVDSLKTGHLPGDLRRLRRSLQSFLLAGLVFHGRNEIVFKEV